MVQAVAQKPRQEELRTDRGRHSPHSVTLTWLFRKAEGASQSKIFPNADFGYWKVTVERPLRLQSQLSIKAIESLRFASGDEDIRCEFTDDLATRLFAICQCERGLKTACRWGRATKRTRMAREKPARNAACRRRKGRSCLTPPLGSVTKLVETGPLPCARSSARNVFEDHNDIPRISG